MMEKVIKNEELLQEKLTMKNTIVIETNTSRESQIQFQI